MLASFVNIKNIEILSKYSHWLDTRHVSSYRWKPYIKGAAVPDTRVPTLHAVLKPGTSDSAIPTDCGELWHFTLCWNLAHPTLLFQRTVVSYDTSRCVETLYIQPCYGCGPRWATILDAVLKPCTSDPASPRDCAVWEASYDTWLRSCHSSLAEPVF